MDAPLKKILKDIQNEYGMDDDMIDPIIKKLNKEFYFKLKDIKNLTEDTWNKFELPTNLYYILNELYQTALNQSNQNNPNQNNPNQNNPNQNFQKQNFQNQNFQNQNLQNQNAQNQNIKKPPIDEEISTKPHLVVQKPLNKNPSIETSEFNSDQIQMHLAKIFTDIDNIDISKDVFHFIYTIINNISQNPNEEKYRRINIKKLLTKYNYPSIKHFLQYLHFKEIDDYMYLIGNVNSLINIIPELNGFIKVNKLAESNFNPYQASIASIGNNEQKLKDISSKQANFEDLYYEEIKRRNNIINNTKINRNPKSYEVNNQYSLNNVINKMNEIENYDDMISNSEDDKLIYKNAMNLIKENQNNRFTLKSRMHFENLMNTPIYVKSDIRFKFPDSNILEASFGLNEKIGDLYKFLKEYLINPNEKFTISTTPPPKKYIKVNETIQDNKLYPQVLMYVNFDSEYSGLIKEKIEKIKINMNFD